MEKRISNFLKLLHTLKPILKKNYSVSDIAVFGSFVRGEEKPESDLDILVTFSKTPDLFDLAAMTVLLEKKLSIKIDLVPNQNLKTEIAQHILSEKVDVF